MSKFHRPTFLRDLLQLDAMIFRIEYIDYAKQFVIRSLSSYCQSKRRTNKLDAVQQGCNGMILRRSTREKRVYEEDENKLVLQKIV